MINIVIPNAMIVSRFISELLIDLCLTIEDASGSQLIHSVTDKIFDTLFTIKGKKTDFKYKKTLEILSLSDIVKFISCKEN